MTPEQRGRVYSAILAWLDETVDLDDYYPDEQERFKLLDAIEEALDMEFENNG